MLFIFNGEIWYVMIVAWRGDTVHVKNDSFSIMGAKIWNSIPENLQNSSKSLSKEKVHTILLKIFEVQDRYADLNTIISDFKKY